MQKAVTVQEAVTSQKAVTLEKMVTSQKTVMLQKMAISQKGQEPINKNKDETKMKRRRWHSGCDARVVGICVFSLIGQIVGAMLI